MLARVSVPIALLFTLVLSGSSPDPRAVDGDLITDYGLEVAAAQTDLAIRGIVTAATYDCEFYSGTSRPRHSTALLKVAIKEVLFGKPDEDYVTVRVYGVPREDCMKWPGSSHPSEFKVGAEYFLMCYRPFDWISRSFTDEWHCRVNGLYCLDADEIAPCSGTRKFGISHPLARLGEIFARLSPGELFDAADVVIIARDFTLPGQAVERPQMKDVPIHQAFKCVVEAVLKGELASSSLLVRGFVSGNPVEEQYVSPIIDHHDKALLFLMSGESGFHLLWNNRGYCPLVGGRVLSSTRVPLGYRVDERNALHREE